MDEISWFLLVALLSWGAWLAGVRIAGRSRRAARCTLVTAGSLLVMWVWLMKRPAVAAEILPIGVLSQIEGVGSLPWFMLLLGAAWARSVRPRQKVVIGWAMLLGLMVFVNGGRWMLQSTPSAVMGAERGALTVLQSQDYTCVPASCATMLNRLGHRTTEAEMAELTRTRPGVGSTSMRAVDGVNRLLAQAGVPERAVLLELELDEVTDGLLPVMTPVNLEPGRRHMVVITGHRRGFIEVVDPMEGTTLYERDEFRAIYGGHVVAIP